jgi:hypothetical protein
MRRAALVLVLLAPSFSREALASERFLTVIQELSSKATLECTVCHLTNEGKPGTVVRPFGRTAKDKYNLTFFADDGTLKKIIADMEKNGDDSDGDGDGDIFELRSGTNPNIPHGADQAPDDAPRYGFFCATVPGRQGSLGVLSAWLAALIFAALHIASRRRRAAFER